jgi:hypothetical protein
MEPYRTKGTSLFREDSNRAGGGGRGWKQKKKVRHVGSDAFFESVRESLTSRTDTEKEKIRPQVRARLVVGVVLAGEDTARQSRRRSEWQDREKKEKVEPLVCLQLRTRLGLGGGAGGGMDEGMETKRKKRFTSCPRGVEEAETFDFSTQSKQLRSGRRASRTSQTDTE